MWAGLGKGTLRRKNWNWDIGSRSKSSEKFFLSPIFVFGRISHSDPYSTSMPNFTCQNDLKTPSVPWKDKLLFILSHSRSKINGEWAEFQLALKKGHSFETTACTLQLTFGLKFTATVNRVAKDSNTGHETLWKLKRTLRKLR